MQRIFTENDVIQYVYGELSPSKSASLVLELEQNNTLREFYFQTIETIDILKADFLESNKWTPNLTSIDIIMEYAHSDRQLAE